MTKGKYGGAKASYSQAREDLRRASRSVRLFGVTLESKEAPTAAVTIWYCGFSNRGVERRECTNRIWHIPQEAIVASGDLPDFECHGHSVKWYDIVRTALITEELYDTFSIESLLTSARTAEAAPPTILEQIHGAGAPVIIPLPSEPLPSEPTPTPKKPVPIIIDLPNEPLPSEPNPTPIQPVPIIVSP